MNSHYRNSCGCDKSTGTTWNSAGGNVSDMEFSSCHKSKKSLAMAYVPWQTWQNVMDGCNGLKHGSIFEDLILPFEGVNAACSFCERKDGRNANYNNYYRRGMK